MLILVFTHLCTREDFLSFLISNSQLVVEVLDKMRVFFPYLGLGNIREGRKENVMNGLP